MKTLKRFLMIILFLNSLAFAQKKNITIQALDWKNKGFGSALPHWLLDTDTINFNALKAENNLSKKIIVIVYSENKNLSLAQKKAASFEYSPLLAKKIHSFITDDKTKLEILDLKSDSLRFSGFTKIADTWIKTFSKDNDSLKTKESFTAAEIYAIDKSDYKVMLNFYLTNIKEFLPELTEEKKASSLNKALDCDFIFCAQDTDGL